MIMVICNVTVFKMESSQWNYVGLMSTEIATKKKNEGRKKSMRLQLPRKALIQRESYEKKNNFQRKTILWIQN